MTTAYRITSPEGEVTELDNLADAIAHVGGRRGFNIKVVTTVDTPCPRHPAYEADYCPACGTARVIGGVVGR